MAKGELNAADMLLQGSRDIPNRKHCKLMNAVFRRENIDGKQNLLQDTRANIAWDL
jgi:hypothetical protein